MWETGEDHSEKNYFLKLEISVNPNVGPEGIPAIFFGKPSLSRSTVGHSD